MVNRDSSVSNVIKTSRFQFQTGREFAFFATASRPALESAQLTLHCVPHVIQQRLEGDHISSKD